MCGRVFYHDITSLTWAPSVGVAGLQAALNMCRGACRWHFLKDCLVTQTGIITHFHASILPLWNVTPDWVSLHFNLAARSPFHCTWVFRTLLCHYPLVFNFPTCDYILTLSCLHLPLLDPIPAWSGFKAGRSWMCRLHFVLGKSSKFFWSWSTKDESVADNESVADDIT